MVHFLRLWLRQIKAYIAEVLNAYDFAKPWPTVMDAASAALEQV